MIEYKLYLLDIQIIPTLDTLENVVKKVLWAIEFYDTDNPEIFKSVGAVETILDTNNIAVEDFVQINSLSHSQIIEWVFAIQGGEEFIENIRPIHVGNIMEAKEKFNWTSYNLDLLVQQ